MRDLCSDSLDKHSHNTHKLVSWVMCTYGAAWGQGTWDLFNSQVGRVVPQPVSRVRVGSGVACRALDTCVQGTECLSAVALPILDKTDARARCCTGVLYSCGTCTQCRCPCLQVGFCPLGPAALSLRMVHTLFTLKCDGRPDWQLRCAVLLVSWMAACATQVSQRQTGWWGLVFGWVLVQGEAGGVTAHHVRWLGEGMNLYSNAHSRRAQTPLPTLAALHTLSHYSVWCFVWTSTGVLSCMQFNTEYTAFKTLCVCVSCCCCPAAGCAGVQPEMAGLLLRAAPHHPSRRQGAAARHQRHSLWHQTVCTLRGAACSLGSSQGRWPLSCLGRWWPCQQLRIGGSSSASAAAAARLGRLAT